MSNLIICTTPNKFVLFNVNEQIYLELYICICLFDSERGKAVKDPVRFPKEPKYFHTLVSPLGRKRQPTESTLLKTFFSNI